MTTKANRPPPKPLRQGRLHSIASTAYPYGRITPTTTTVAAADLPKAMLRRLAEQAVPVRNCTMRGEPYTCPELRTHPRQTARASSLPSRVGQRLHHPDGRVTDLAGYPTTP